MITDETPISHRIKELFASIDRKDSRAFASFLSDDARFRFGNNPPVRGRDAIAASVDDFFSSIATLTHLIDKTWVHSDSVICHGKVTYGRLDGSSITLPFADVFFLQDDLICDYLIYMDVTPLYASSK